MAKRTRPLNPAEQLAEPTASDIAGRIGSDSRQLARRIDAAEARSLAADDPYDGLRELGVSIEKALAEAELHRPTVYPRF